MRSAPQLRCAACNRHSPAACTAGRQAGTYGHLPSHRRASGALPKPSYMSLCVSPVPSQSCTSCGCTGMRFECGHYLPQISLSRTTFSRRQGLCHYCLELVCSRQQLCMPDAVILYLLGCPWPERQWAELCTCISTLPPDGQPVTATTGQNAPAMAAALS